MLENYFVWNNTQNNHREIFLRNLYAQLFSRIREPNYGNSMFIVSGVENGAISPPPKVWKWKEIDDSSTFNFLLYFVALWTPRCLIELILWMHLHRCRNGKGDATLNSVGNSFGTSFVEKFEHLLYSSKIQNIIYLASSFPNLLKALCNCPSCAWWSEQFDFVFQYLKFHSIKAMSGLLKYDLISSLIRYNTCKNDLYLDFYGI